ncbi:MAG: hypothetical protein RJB39_665 [Candidatus Parcubacteria bacterium]
MELCGGNRLVMIGVVFELRAHLCFRVRFRSVITTIVVAGVEGEVCDEGKGEEPAEGLVGRCRDGDSHGSVCGFRCEWNCY